MERKKMKRFHTYLQAQQPAFKVPREVLEDQFKNPSSAAIKFYKAQAMSYYKQLEQLKSKPKANKKNFLRFSSMQVGSTLTKIRQPFLPHLLSQLIVFGCPQTVIMESEPTKQSTKQPKALCSTSSCSLIKNCSMFPFPRGVMLMRIQKQEIEQEVNLILSQPINSRKTFMFTSRIQDEADINQLYSIYDTASADLLKSKYQDLKDKKLFCVGIGFVDFLAQTDFVKHQKVYSVCSVYPCIQFMTQYLIKLLLTAKEMRFQEMDKKGKHAYSRYDSRFMNSTVIKLASDHMPIYSPNYVPFGLSYNQNFTKTNSNLIGFLNVEQYLDLVNCVLLGQKLIIKYKVSNVLTRLIFLLTEVLFKPLQYPYPIIYLLPEALEEYLGSPLPLIVGTQLVHLQNPPDSSILTIGIQTTFQRNIKLPKLQSLRKELQKPFQEFAQLQSKYKRNKDNQMNFQQKQSAAVQIINLTKKFIETQIVMKMPNAETLKKQSEKFEKLTENSYIDLHEYLVKFSGRHLIRNSTSESFIEKFVTTQMFNNYVQDLTK